MRKPITKEQLKVLAETIPVHLVDIRSKQEYESQHIPVAIHIPAEELSSVSKMFCKTDTLVCICNHGKERSQSAAENLYNQGFENVFYLEGGVGKWFTD